MSRQQIDSPAAQTQPIQVIKAAGRQFTQCAVGLLKHPLRQRIPGLFRLQQILDHIRRNERIGIRR
ncbi:hypothetical protein D3C78_1656390 [compost metagenome]